MTLRIDISGSEEVERIVKRINEGDGTVAVAKFSISASEQFVLVSTSAKVEARAVSGLFEARQACYVLCGRSSPASWTLITWIPDEADAHQRLLYASAKHSFRKRFNSDRVVDAVHFTTRPEVDEYFGGGCGRKTAEPDQFLSSLERDLNSLKVSEAKSAVDRGIGTVTRTLGNLSMPLDGDLVDALKRWTKTEPSANYLRIQIDTESERMMLKESGAIGVQELATRIPNDGAAYHLFRFVHEHKGTSVTNCNVFIYSMAGYANCPLKHRMLYSTYKNFLVAQIESHGIRIAKKLEIENGAEVAESCLLAELYPDDRVAGNVKKSFSKPAAPSNRGPRRIIK